jgi:hypothetical protein
MEVMDSWDMSRKSVDRGSLVDAVTLPMVPLRARPSASQRAGFKT